MPVSPYLNSRSFDPETIECMGAAFEAVCTELRLKAQPDPITEAVAKRVLMLTLQNERDPAALTARVLSALKNASSASSMAGRGPSCTSRGEQLAQYFSGLDHIGVVGPVSLFAAVIFLEERYGLERAEARRVFRLWAATYDRDKPAATRAAIASEHH